MLTDADYRALAAFRHQLRKFLAFSEAAARKAGIEPRQHQLLLALRGLPRDSEPSIGVLAEMMVLRHHTVVELLDRLEAGGLVRRERASDDRRRARIVITPRGVALLHALSGAHVDELGELAPSLVTSLTSVLRVPRRSAS